MPRHIQLLIHFPHDEAAYFHNQVWFKYLSASRCKSGIPPFLPRRKGDWCDGDREFFSLFIPTVMSHHEENSRFDSLSIILKDFFNNFESTQVIENLLFIAADFAENPPEGISDNMAYQWLYQMNSLAVLLPRLEIALLQSQSKTA